MSHQIPNLSPPDASTQAAPRRPRYNYAPSRSGDEAVAVALRELPPIDMRLVAIGSLLFAAAFLSLYWGSLVPLIDTWSRDSAWGHGFLVPAISAYLVSLRWAELRQMQIRSAKAGLVILFVGVIGQVLFRATGTTHMSHLSIIVVLMGAALWVLGWQYMRVLWLPIAYFVFAINPPLTLYQKATEPMQRIAASLGELMLPIFGVQAQREGVVIRVFWHGKDQQLDVEQACSGMKMLVAFTAVAVALAYTSNRPMWQKLFLAACSIPVAIFCNAIRVALIGYLVVAVDERWGHGDAHGWAGMLMLVPAALMQIGIAWMLDRIFVDDDEPAPAGGGAA